MKPLSTLLAEAFEEAGDGFGAYIGARRGTVLRLDGGSNHRYKTHCPQGHPYSGDNLIIKTLPRGTPNRVCRECQRQRSRRRSAERRALVAGKSPEQQVKDG